MNLYQNMFKHILAQESPCSVCPFLSEPPNKIIEMENYRTLQEIQFLLQDDSLDDLECLSKIEETIFIYEKSDDDSRICPNFN